VFFCKEVLLSRGFDCRIRRTTSYDGARNPGDEVRIVIKWRKKRRRFRDKMEDKWQKMSIDIKLG
jgi:hypothetical protein